MENKKLSFGKSVAKRHEELVNNDPAPNKADQNIINTVSKIVSNKAEAMRDFNLKPVTKSNKFELERELYDVFSFLAGKFNKDISELASEYVLACFKADYKKYKNQFNLPNLPDLEK